MGYFNHNDGQSQLQNYSFAIRVRVCPCLSLSFSLSLFLSFSLFLSLSRARTRKRTYTHQGGGDHESTAASFLHPLGCPTQMLQVTPGARHRNIPRTQNSKSHARRTASRGGVAIPPPRLCSLTLHPTPYILHPTSYTLHPAPYTLHPTPCTLHPAPYTLHPAPCTLHPIPQTLTRKPAATGDALDPCAFIRPAPTNPTLRDPGPGFRVQGSGFTV